MSVMFEKFENRTGITKTLKIPETGMGMGEIEDFVS
jgi:hypothetical protein